MKKLVITILAILSLSSCKQDNEAKLITIHGKVVKHHTVEEVPGVEVHAFNSGGPLHGDKTFGASISDDAGNYSIQLERDPYLSLSLEVDYPRSYVTYNFFDANGNMIDPFFASFPNEDLHMDVQLYCAGFLSIRFEDQNLYDFDRIEFVRDAISYKSRREYLHEIKPVFSTLAYFTDSVRFNYFDTYINSEGMVEDSLLFQRWHVFTTTNCDTSLLTIGY